MFAPHRIADEHPVTILQIVPRVPGGLDGVGDYALNLAANFRDGFGCPTVFVAPDNSPPPSVCGFEVRSLRGVVDDQEFDRIILHYVNYGYQKRGTPFGLLSILRDLRARRRVKLLTVFHELYASAPPWKSAFWLRPFQVYLAKATARLSDECLVSSEPFVRKLHRLVSAASVHLHPVPSGFGEPELSPEQIENRDPHRWVIVGGTALAQRSLQSFIENIRNIPESITPKKLSVVGGDDNPAARSMLAGLAIESDYRPRATVSEAAGILKNCSFGWLDYFHKADVEGSVALKSTAFGALCAHAVIPMFPHHCSAIFIDGDALPGPFFVGPSGSEIPNVRDRAKIAINIYQWYQRHAASQHLAEKIAAVLGLERTFR